MLTLKREACSLSLSLYLLYQENKFNRLYGEERSSRGTIARSSMLRTYHVFRQVKGVRPSRRMRHYNPVRLFFMLGPHHQSVGFSLDNPIIVLHPIRFELGTLCPCSRQSRAKHFSFLKTLFNTARTWLTIISSNTYFKSIEALLLLFLALMRNRAF